MLEPWYRVVLPRKEVREGRSFNPDEFAIALEQVVGRHGAEPTTANPRPSSRAPASRGRCASTREWSLRRLAGETSNTAPVMDARDAVRRRQDPHADCALYHLVTAGGKAGHLDDVSRLLHEAGLSAAPAARVAVFVGNAWDPHEGREAPWIDVARQLAGDRGVELLGTNAATIPAGHRGVGEGVSRRANAPVLVLFDEVLNFVNPLPRAGR